LKPVFIIIPAYNEQRILSTVVNSIRSVTVSPIIIVDDGSAEPIAEDHSAGNIFYLRHATNLGQGAAIATGIAFSLQQGAEILVTFDADGQHDPNDIAKMIAPVEKGIADITLGSRFMGSLNKVPLTRRILIKMACLFHYMLTGVWMTDAHNGFRAMNRKAAQMIRIKEKRMAHASEIIFEIKRHKLKWQEVSVNIIYTPYSLAKGQPLVNSIRIFFDVVLHKLFR
jgi:polyprenyl-phospho-N-acetylgalactosaminyl synthase